MRIVLQNGNQKERRLYLPNALVLNRLTSFWVAKGLQKHGIHLAHGQIRKLAESIKDVQKLHPDWVLLEAEDAKGETIRIMI